MIQDIAPHKYNVTFINKEINQEGFFLSFFEGKILCGVNEGKLCLPRVKDVRDNGKIVYLFSIDDIPYFTKLEKKCLKIDYYNYEEINIVRSHTSEYYAFAIATAFQLYNWYISNKYCGNCGAPMIESRKERALVCNCCGKTIYPTLSPSVIVALIDKDKILLSKYQPKHSKYTKYALLAGYCEIGETAEDTVRREVAEEVGLKVKNITYYKSQPWSLSGALLFGYFCELDGDNTIKLEEDELSEAKWFERENIPKNESTASLTNEMITLFSNKEEWGKYYGKIRQ